MGLLALCRHLSVKAHMMTRIEQPLEILDRHELKGTAVTVYLDRIGSSWFVGSRSWTAKDALLYAIGVGAGQDDTADELHFTTENSIGIEQQVIPTYAVVIGTGGSLDRFGDFPLSSILHAEQAVTLYQALPARGRVEITERLVDIQDKSKGALITTETDTIDLSSGARIATSRTTIFVRGEGGFGSPVKAKEVWAPPDRAPDYIVSYHVPIQQALVYRLSGDVNPLHSDPKAAGEAGFERPILHGLCTYGYTARALLKALCDFNAGSFGYMAARFSTPVIPGETLTIRIWDEGNAAQFQAYVGNRLVLDRGKFRRRAA